MDNYTAFISNQKDSSFNTLSSHKNELTAECVQVKSPTTNGVVNNNTTPAALDANGNEYDPDQKVLAEVGLIDIVFPRDRPIESNAGKVLCHGYENKLREFVHYQPLQTHKAPDIPEAIKVASPEGRRMLKQALDSPYMEAYYTVSPQIDNQPEFTCGTSSLVVVLNSLDIDPARATWNEEWRWNHLGSLSCCMVELQNPNITLEQFARLAVCNDVRVLTKTVSDDWTLEHLRQWVKMAVSRSEMVMVVNHGRRQMNQEGSGHFLPMTGYHEESDMILNFDIAKHKYVPQWLPLEMMLNAVKAKDDRTGDNRGFALLARPNYESSERIFGPSIIFRIDDIPGRMDARLKLVMGKWNRLLNGNISTNSTYQDIMKTTIHHLLSITQSQSASDDGATLPNISLLEMTLIYFRNHPSDHNSSPSIVARCRRPQCPKNCPNTVFCQQIESLDIFQNVRRAMECWAYREKTQILNLIVGQLDDIDTALTFAKKTSQSYASMERTQTFFKELYHYNPDGKSEGLENGHSNGSEILKMQCPGFIELFPEHIATFILLSWPYVNKVENMFGQDAFVPILKEYNLSHEDSGFNGEKETQNITIKLEDEKAHYCTRGDSFERETSLREYLDTIVCEELQRCHDRVLNEQIRGVKGKLSVVLDYHNLFE